MRQLVQLQEKYPDFKALDCEIISIQREEKDGVPGLVKVGERTKAEFQITGDLGKKETRAYSQEGFNTYVIDKNGVVQAILNGVKLKRPSGEKVYQKTKSALAEKVKGGK